MGDERLYPQQKFPFEQTLEMFGTIKPGAPSSSNNTMLLAMLWTQSQTQQISTNFLLHCSTTAQYQAEQVHIIQVKHPSAGKCQTHRSEPVARSHPVLCQGVHKCPKGAHAKFCNLLLQMLLYDPAGPRAQT